MGGESRKISEHVQEGYEPADKGTLGVCAKATGYEEFDASGTPMTIRLCKSLHGLRLSPNWWWSMVYKRLAEIGFRSMKPNPCVYIYHGKGDFYTSLCLER